MSRPSSQSSPLALVLRGLVELRPAPPGRWPYALRAALCMGVPIMLGWLAGDVAAGLMAAIGGFTALYGSGLPYLRRAQLLAGIALAFALAVGLGIAVSGGSWAAVLVVAAIAMLATWLANSLQVGPPGAYMVVLACAAGTAMPAHFPPLHASGLVLCGGALAWAVHMAGGLLSPRGPERGAVRAAGDAVADFVAAVGTSRESPDRHRAAFALHQAWGTLVSQQPATVRTSGRLGRLRTLNRELHLCFAEAMGAASARLPVRSTLRAEVRALVSKVDTLDGLAGTPADDVPLGHPGPMAAMREALQPGSSARRVVLRVGIAALLAGILGAALHLERAYWAIAAAVLMLHQGYDWLRMVQRSTQRLLGTWIGLLLAGAILLVHPQGPWLALLLMALQFAIEMLVMRNFALATVFITGAALAIASGGQPIESPGDYLLARGVDTFVGCMVALAVFRLLPPPDVHARLPQALAGALWAVDAAVVHLARGQVTTADAKRARQQLQRASFALQAAHEDGLAGSAHERRAAEQAWPSIAAVERLVYRTLSACWALERLGGDGARQSAAAMFGHEGESRVHRALDGLISAVRDGVEPLAVEDLPPMLGAELDNVRLCLSREPVEATTAAW